MPYHGIAIEQIEAPPPQKPGERCADWFRLACHPLPAGR